MQDMAEKSKFGKILYNNTFETTQIDIIFHTKKLRGGGEKDWEILTESQRWGKQSGRWKKRMK